MPSTNPSPVTRSGPAGEGRTSSRRSFVSLVPLDGGRPGRPKGGNPGETGDGQRCEEPEQRGTRGGLADEEAARTQPDDREQPAGPTPGRHGFDDEQQRGDARGEDGELVRMDGRARRGHEAGQRFERAGRLAEKAEADRPVVDELRDHDHGLEADRAGQGPHQDAQRSAGDDARAVSAAMMPIPTHRSAVVMPASDGWPAKAMSTPRTASPSDPPMVGRRGDERHCASRITTSATIATSVGPTSPRLDGNASVTNESKNTLNSGHFEGEPSQPLPIGGRRARRCRRCGHGEHRSCHRPRSFVH